MSIIEVSAIKHVKLLGMDCRCEERTVYSGDVYGAYCDFYGQSFKWCYLSGGKDGASCPGAVLSTDGSSDEPFYWTKDEAVCAGISKQILFIIQLYLRELAVHHANVEPPGYQFFLKIIKLCTPGSCNRRRYDNLNSSLIPFTLYSIMQPYLILLYALVSYFQPIEH